MLIQDVVSRQGAAVMAAGTPRLRNSVKGGARSRDSAPFSLLEATGVGLDELPDEMPSNFLCPISLEPMKDPVTLCTGQTFERQSIDKWLAAGNMTCPTTMQRLTDTSLIPNHTLRHVIEEWHRRQGFKARRRAKKQAAPVKDTTPADVRAVLEEITLCKGLEEIMLSKGQGVIMKDLKGQEVRVLRSPEYSDSMWRQAVDASLHQELVDGLLHMDIKEGFHLDGGRVEGIDVGWPGEFDLNPPRQIVGFDLPSPHGPPACQASTDSSSDELEDQQPGRPRVKDAHHQAMVVDSIRESQVGRRQGVGDTNPLKKSEPKSSQDLVIQEAPRLTNMKGKLATKSLQTRELNVATKKGGTTRWKDTVVAKWHEIVSQAIRRGPSRGQKARNSTEGESKRASNVSAAGLAGTPNGSHEARVYSSSSKLRKCLTMSPITESRTSEGVASGSNPSHRRQLSGSTIRERSCHSIYDFSCDRVAVDPTTWEDLLRPRNQHESLRTVQRKGSLSRSPPAAARDASQQSDGLHRQAGLYGTSVGTEQAVTSGKWPLRRLIIRPKSDQTSYLDRRREGKVPQQQHDPVTEMLNAGHEFPDPSSSPYDTVNTDGCSQGSGTLSDFGREISLYSPQESHASTVHWQGFIYPEQISLLSGPLSGPVSPLSVLEASAASEIVSPFSRLASTSAGGASPLSGFTSPFPGLASPLSGPLSGPISWPMSGPLSPFSVHSSSRSQSIGCITPPPTTQDDDFPYGPDDVVHKRELKKAVQGDSLISPAASNGGQSDDVAASMFPVLYTNHWENPLSSVSAGLCSPISRHLENPEHDFLANPPPSPNKNFPSPVSGHAELSHSGPDGLQAMRLEALKKLHKFAASEHIHRFGMLDETVPVLLTALIPTLKSYNKGDVDYAKECASMVVKTLIVLMPLTFRSATQLAEQGVLEALIEQAGEDSSTGTRISVVTLVGHIVETLVDGVSNAASDGDSLTSELDTFTEGFHAASGLGNGWSGRIAPAMLDQDTHRYPRVPSVPDQKCVARIVMEIATHRSLLQKIIRLLQTGRRNSQAAIASITTIHLFCTHCSTALLSTIAAGAIPALVDLLPLGVAPAEDRIADRAGKILQLLELACGTTQGRLALMHHYRSSIPRLVACLRPKNERRTEVALSVLSSLLAAPHESGQSDKLSVAAVEAGAASKLVLLIQSGCSGAIKTKCTELLKYLSNKYSATTMFLFHNNLTQTLQ